jgi:hypothetical protein
MAAAAETGNWYRADRDFAEACARAKQEQQAFLGATALSGCVEVEQPANNSTMLAAVQAGRLGDQQALKMVRANVATDVSERLYKTGLSKVELNVHNNQLQQQGRRLADVNRNTLLYSQLTPEMERRSRYDMQHVFVIEALIPTGVLDTHDAIILSPTPTTMSAAEKTKWGMFADTESFSVQRFSINGSQACLETALVAGRPAPGADRQDIALLKQLAEQAGVALPTTDGTELLQYMMLVPKAELPNGVSDIVKRYDDLTGTFYGQSKPRQDYQQYARDCEARNQAFSGIVDDITDQLLREAHLYTSPLEVIKRVDELSSRLCVKYAASNTAVNVAVFGKQTAQHLAEYQFFMARGDTDSANSSLIKAQNSDQSGSCPLFKGSPEASAEGASATSNQASESSGKKTMHCPFCSAKVYDDPCAKVLSCWDCKALVVNGKLKSKGNGGSKAAEAVKARQLQARLAVRRTEAAERVSQQLALSSVY